MIRFFHTTSSFSKVIPNNIKNALYRAIDEIVLEKPVQLTRDGFTATTTLSGGINVKIYPGAEDTNTMVTASRDGVTVYREINEQWLTNWHLSPTNASKPGIK